MLRNFIFFHSGSSAILSPRKSGESCLSKDQREDPLMCPTEVNQTKELVSKPTRTELSVDFWIWLPNRSPLCVESKEKR